MAKLIEVNTFNQNDGILAVLEPPLLSISIKRVFWIYNNSGDNIRGKHRHKKSTHILVCMVGSCKVLVNNNKNHEIYLLNNPNQALLLEPSDWREMYDFSENCVIACFSDELYDPNDYIVVPYLSKNRQTYLAK